MIHLCLGAAVAQGAEVALQLVAVGVGGLHPGHGGGVVPVVAVDGVVKGMQERLNKYLQYISNICLNIQSIYSEQLHIDSMN